jgi:hypothetical protein
VVCQNFLDSPAFHKRFHRSELDDVVIVIRILTSGLQHFRFLNIGERMVFHNLPQIMVRMCVSNAYLFPKGNRNFMVQLYYLSCIQKPIRSNEFSPLRHFPFPLKGNVISYSKMSAILRSEKVLPLPNISEVENPKKLVEISEDVNFPWIWSKLFLSIIREILVFQGENDRDSTQHQSKRPHNPERRSKEDVQSIWRNATGGT